MTTDIETIPTPAADEVVTAVQKFNATEAGIADLTEKYAGVIFDVDESDGMKAAQAARKEIRRPRFAIEHVRTAAKAPILALGKSIDAAAKSLTAALFALETPIDDQIKDEEKKIKDAEEAKRREEEERIAAINTRIAFFGETFEKARKEQANSDLIVQYMDDLDRIEIEGFEEFSDVAASQKHHAMKSLGALHEEMLKAEADAAELQLLREEKQERAKQQFAERQALLDESIEGEYEKEDVDGSIGALPRTQASTDCGDLDAGEATVLGLKEIVEEIGPQTIEEVKWFPGRNSIVAALAKAFGVPEALASEWIDLCHHEVVDEPSALDKIRSAQPLF